MADYKTKISEKEFLKLILKRESLFKELEKAADIDIKAIQSEFQLYESFVQSAVVDETKSLLEDDIRSLTEVVGGAPTINPLNPVNAQSQAAASETEAILGYSPQSSASSGPRYISIQAFNYEALQDINDPFSMEDGLVIKTTKKPEIGSGWDEVVSVEDITLYNSNQWAYNTNPRDNMVTTNTSNYITLTYRTDAFQTAGGFYNITANNGITSVDLKVTFQSGHIEYFSSQPVSGPNAGPIDVPVGRQYKNNLDYNYLVGALDLQQAVRPCSGTDPATGLLYTGSQFYSQGANVLKSPNTISDYSILSRWMPHVNPSGTMQERGQYTDFLALNSGSNPFLHLCSPIIYGWGDQAAGFLNGNNGGLVTINKAESGRQVISRLDVHWQHNNASSANAINGKNAAWFISNYNIGPSYVPQTVNYRFDDQESGNDPTAWASILYHMYNTNQEQYLFTNTYYYGENIPNCILPPDNPTKSYNVCDDPNNPSHYAVTAKDCSGTTIPATDLPGGANYASINYTHNPSCCTDCRLNLNATPFNSSYGGGSDGGFTWTVEDSLGNPTGDPFASGSMYTVVVTNSTNALAGTQLPSGGNTVTDATCDTNTTAGTEHLVTCNSSVVIKPGMQVSGTGIPLNTFVGDITLGVVGINVLQFQLVTAAGVLVSATAANTDTTLTFSTGSSGIHGGLAANTLANPYYTVTVTDDEGCIETINISIKEGTVPPPGCTDNTAVNYNSAAVADDGSCILCDAVDGLLHDPLGSNSTDLFDSTNTAGISATSSGVNTHNSDGQLSVTAAPIAAAWAYMDQDANSKFELLLYKTDNPGEASTANGAVQIGGTINAGTLDNVSVANHNFTGLAYGYYTIRVRYVDTNTTSTLENCYTEFFGVVQAEVCDDQTSTTYFGIPFAPALRDSTSYLCQYPIPCCNLDPVTLANNKFPCSPAIQTEVDCDPGRTVVLEWLYSLTGSSYTSLGSLNLGMLGGSGSVFSTSTGALNSGTNFFTQDGYYKAKITATTASGDVCIEEESGYFQVPRTGCMDQGAYNYDATAVCPGPCAFPSWDCEALTGMCVDPWNGSIIGYVAGAYNCLTGAGCCNSYCTPPNTNGCTDSCATNYDPTATTDDGSCMYTACLDFAATNQYQNCCNNNFYPPAQIISQDNSCCINPCSSTNTGTITTTDSTGNCTVFNNDGSATISVVINNSSPTWTWTIFDNTGTVIVYADTTNYSGSTTATYSSLNTGNYKAVVEDTFGCIFEVLFTIGSTSPNVGCTDPTADNYDPLATCDCCCQVAGCLDPNSSNYNPNANVPGQCDYIDPPPSPCIPDTLEKDKLKVDVCLSLKGSKYLKDYKIGRADDCTLMNKWKLILIDYLLEQDGLSCLFNCADIRTPNPSAVQNCNDLWVTGGPSTGLNHNVNHAGASIVNPGEGTTILAYDNFPTGWFGYVSGSNPASNQSFVGDVIKFDLPTGHPLEVWLNGTIWTLTTIPPTGTMHQGCKNQKIQHYTQCLDYNTISITTTTNYYDNFLNFVNKFCADCDISILNQRK